MDTGVLRIDAVELVKHLRIFRKQSEEVLISKRKLIKESRSGTIVGNVLWHGRVNMDDERWSPEELQDFVYRYLGGGSSAKGWRGKIANVFSQSLNLPAWYFVNTNFVNVADGTFWGRSTMTRRLRPEYRLKQPDTQETCQETFSEAQRIIKLYAHLSNLTFSIGAGFQVKWRSSRTVGISRRFGK